MNEYPCTECANKHKDVCHCMKWRKWFIQEWRDTRRIYQPSLPKLSEEDADRINRLVSYGGRKNEN